MNWKSIIGLAGRTEALWPRRALVALLALGSIVRLIPLLNVGGRMLQQWPTEDGYLTLTIARNFALGNGFSVAGGTVATNGTQPLSTLIYALGFWAVGGDKTSGVLLAQLWQLAVALGSAVLLYRLTLEVLHSYRWRDWTACLAAGAWFVNPTLTPHTMNCLETGMVILVGLQLLRTWHRWILREAEGVDWRAAGKTGLMMGLAGWARVDTVFLMTALALAHLHLGWRRRRVVAAVGEVSLMAALAGICVLPWLLFGKLTFGYWVPISGIAESHGAKFGHNALQIPVKLFEYINGVVGLPSSLEARPAVLVVCVVCVGAWLYLVRLALKRASIVQSHLAYAGLLHGGLLGGYYGLLFGAPHFVSRYLAVLSPLVFLFTALCVVHLLCGRPRWMAVASAAVAGLLVLVQQARLYQIGVPHPHWQVVQWVEQNVPDDVWVAAIQTGTLGFFHDRTLNLDGKVDPRALAALLADKHHQYIAESQAQALIDWSGLSELMEDGDIISSQFKVKLLDPEHNLTVLVRRNGPLD